MAGEGANDGYRSSWAIRENGEFETIAEWNSKACPNRSEKAKRLIEGEVRLRLAAGPEDWKDVVVRGVDDLKYLLGEVLCMGSRALLGESYEIGTLTVQGRKLRLHVENGVDIYRMPSAVVYLQEGAVGIDEHWDDGWMLGVQEFNDGCNAAVSSMVSLVAEVLGESQGIPEDDLAKLKVIVDRFG